MDRTTLDFFNLIWNCTDSYDVIGHHGGFLTENIFFLHFCGIEILYKNDHKREKCENTNVVL